MALSIAGFVVIGTSTPSEDPVRIGYVWMDTSANKLKICTSVTPITFVEVGGAGGSSTWGGITGTLADQTDLQAAFDAKADLLHTHSPADILPLLDNTIVGQVTGSAGFAGMVAVGSGMETLLFGAGLDPTIRIKQSYFDALYAALVHAVQHKSGGADPIALDTLAAPTDIATLNASTSAHGLMQKYPNTTYELLRGDGSFSATLSRDAAQSWVFRTFAGDPGISLTRAQGTAAAPLRTKSTNSLGAFSAGGYNAADDVSTAAANTFPSGWITVTATADHTAASQPAKIVFLTTPVGSAVPLSRWTIGSDGALTPTGSNGSLAVKLDALLAPDDNTTLNATTSAHGLLPKLSGSSSQFLNGAGNFAAASALNSFALTTKVLSPATGNLTISANHSAVAVRQLTILSGRILTVASGSILRIL